MLEEMLVKRRDVKIVERVEIVGRVEMCPQKAIEMCPQKAIEMCPHKAQQRSTTTGERLGPIRGPTRVWIHGEYAVYWCFCTTSM